MTAPSHADIIDKLQKLRILAHNKAAMPGEVEAALRAMSALMARYRISEAELEAAGKKSEISESDDLWPAAKHIPNWRLVFLSTIGSVNGVVVHVSVYPNGTRGVRLAGAESDIAIVKSFWSWLEAEAIRLTWGPLARFPKDARPKRARRLSKFQKDWLIGFATGVAQQIEGQLRKNAPRARADWASGSPAMILVDRRLAETRHWLALHQDTTTVNALKGKKADTDALERGFRAGERYHLGKKLPKGEPA